MIEILEVTDRKHLKQWVHFPFEHYKNHRWYVPQLEIDEQSYFTDKNPAYKIAKVKKFLAYKEGKIVGRVCGIIHSLEEKKLGYRRGRFGWLEMIDDQEVCRLLLSAVEQWLKSEDCVEMTGPHGFTDLDPEGLLIEGYDFYPTISGSYNYPYYQTLIENYGLEKEVDYVEFRSEFPMDFRPFSVMKKKLAKDSTYSLVEVKSRKQMMKYVPEVWEVLEESFEDLYGVTPLTDEQRLFYTRKYFNFLDPKYLKLVFNKETGKMAGFFVAMPNLSKGFKKANGSLLPFGFFHIFQNYRKPDTVDFLLVGVRKAEVSQIVFLILVIAMYETCQKNGILEMETNRELETNTHVSNLWRKFKTLHKRRSRIFKKSI